MLQECLWSQQSTNEKYYPIMFSFILALVSIVSFIASQLVSALANKIYGYGNFDSMIFI